MWVIFIGVSIVKYKVELAYSIISHELNRPRISKTVEFGVVQAAEFDQLPSENEQIIQIDSNMSIPAGA